MPGVCLKLPLTFDAARLERDAAGFTDTDWAPHFNIHYYEGDWSVVPLRAVKGGNLAIAPEIEAPDGYVNTAQMERCEYVPEVLAAFKCEFETVRFLKLAAGSVIKRHRDYGLGIEDGTMRVHVPVVTNDDVEFILDEKRVDMKPGEAWYLNVNHYHSVTNGGSTDRIHLVIDCVVNDWLREMVGISQGLDRPS